MRERLHFFYEVESSLRTGGAHSSFRKTAGELDCFYMRHEKCAGPIGSNLERVSGCAARMACGAGVRAVAGVLKGLRAHRLEPPPCDRG